MKRIIATIVMLTYMAAAIGFSFSFHYCGGEYHGICFTENTEDGCCGSAEESEGCCEDKVVSARYKDDHTPSAFNVIHATAVTPILPPRVFAAPASVALRWFTKIGTLHTGHSPPILRGIPIYLFARVLRL